jgi:predicted RNase H-like HicB family nuclease
VSERVGGERSAVSGRPSFAASRLPSPAFVGTIHRFVAILATMRKSFTAVVERDADTGLLVGYVPGFRGAHSQGSTLDELQQNLREVIEMLLEDGDPQVDSEFVGTQLVTVE